MEKGDGIVLVNEMYRKILLILFAAEDYVTANALANQVGISVKTLRKYIREINDYLEVRGAQICSKVSVGYKIVALDEMMYAQLKNELMNSRSRLIFYENMQRMRINFIFRYLLSVDEGVTIRELSEKLFYSESSIAKDFKIAEHELNSYGIELLNPHGTNGIFLKGNEWKLRNLLIHELHVFENNNLILENEEMEFENLFLINCEERQNIHERLLKALKKNNVNISYAHLKSIEGWIILTKTRKLKSSQISFDKNDIQIVLQSPLYPVARLIYTEVYGKNEIVSEQDIIGLSIYLECCDENIICDEKRLSRIEIDISELFSYLNHYFTNVFDYNQNKESLDVLSKEIKMFLNRQRFINTFGVYLGNTDYLSYIEKNGLFVFNICLVAKKFFSEKLGIMINDVSPLYLMFMSYLSTREDYLKFKYKVLCVLSQSKAQARHVIDMLTLKKLNVLFDANVISYQEIDKIHQNEFDYILTNIEDKEITNLFKIPVIQLSFKKFFFEPTLSINEMSFRRYLISKVLKEEYFIKCNQSYSKLNEVESLIQKLITQMGLGQDFLNDILEKMMMKSSVKKNGVLFLDSMNSYMNESHIGIIYLKKPIKIRSVECKMVCVCHYGFDSHLENMHLIAQIVGDILHDIDFYPTDYELISYQSIIEKIEK